MDRGVFILKADMLDGWMAGSLKRGWTNGEDGGEEECREDLLESLGGVTSDDSRQEQAGAGEGSRDLPLRSTISSNKVLVQMVRLCASPELWRLF